MSSRQSGRSISRRRLVSAVVGVTALAAAGLLAGCGAGQIAETADIVPAVPGANFDLKIDGGVISIRNATIDYPGSEGYKSGDNAPLTLRIINGTTSPVTLTGATATVANSTADAGKVVMVGEAPSAAASAESPVPATLPATRNPTPTPKSSGKGHSAAPSASPSPAASPTESPSAAGPAGSATINVKIPGAPDGLIILSQANSGGTYLEITGLTTPLLPAQTLRLVLTFTLADGSTVQLGNSNVASQQLLVPVAVPESPQPRSPLSFSAGG